MLNRLNSGFNRLNSGTYRRGLSDIMSPNNIGKLSLVRATTATSLNSDALTWAEYASGNQRFYGARQRLIIEGARTNSVPNPRGEGASGATLPTGWTLSATRGLTHTFTRHTLNGVEGVIWNMSGTPDSTSGFDLSFEAGETTSAGISNVISVYYATISGTNPFSTLSLRNAAETVGSATTMTPSSTLQRAINIRTNTGTAYRNRLSPAYPDTVTLVNYSLFLGWPQREMSATFASTPILPVAASPAASTRNTEMYTVALSDLGIAGSGAGTYLWSGLIGQNSPSGVGQVISQLDTGSGTNRILLLNSGGGANVVAARTTASAFLASASSGAFVAGTPFRAGLVIDGVGRAAASLNGNTPAAVSGCPTSGLTTLRLGNDSTGLSSIFGETLSFRYLNYPVSDSELQSLTAAMPT